MTAVEMNPAWALLVPVVLGALALCAAVLDALFVAVSEGRSARAGVAAPLRESARLLQQRRRVTVAADVLLWRIGIGGLVVVAMLQTAVIPLGRSVLADLPIGIVWFNAMDVMLWALFWLIGWGANSAYSLIGGYRSLSQAISYELPLMFAIVPPAIAAHSLRVTDVIAAQQQLWFVVWMPAAFVIFCGCVIAFSSWGPFATAIRSDIAGGVLAELSGVDRLLVLAGRYALLTSGAAFAVTLFLGGGAGPVLPDWIWMLLKTVLLLAGFVFVRHRLPGIRPDRLAEPAWLIALPVILLQTLVVSLIVAGRG